MQGSACINLGQPAAACRVWSEVKSVEDDIAGKSPEASYSTIPGYHAGFICVFDQIVASRLAMAVNWQSKSLGPTCVMYLALFVN